MSSDSSPAPTPTPNALAPLLLFTDEEAQAIWARAAQLQAEGIALARVGAGTGDSEPAAAPPQHLLARPAGMFFAHDLIQSAQEAGIDAAHMAVALAEHEAADHETAIVPSDAQRARFVRELGSDAGSMHALGLVAGTRDQVIAQLRDAFGQPQWQLTFDGVVRAATEAGDVLRFRLPPWLVAKADGTLDAAKATNAFLYHANRIGVLALHVLLEPRGTPDQPAYEVTVTADLRLGQHLNSDFARLLHIVMPAVCAVVGSAIAHELAGGAVPWLSATSALGLGAGLATGVGFMALMRQLMRWEYRSARRVLERGLQGMLRAIGRRSLPKGASSAMIQPPERP